MFRVYLFAREEKGEMGGKPFYRHRIYQLSGKRLIAGSMHRVTKLTLYDQEMAGFSQTERGAFIRKLSELDIYESTCARRHLSRCFIYRFATLFRERYLFNASLNAFTERARDFKIIKIQVQ